MAYYSKEAYEKKREFAYRTSSDSIETLAMAILGKKEIDNQVEELAKELKPIAELSHKRHEIHSTDRKHFINDVDELTKVGNEYSDGCLINDVDELNKKYHLTDAELPLIGDVTVTGQDSDEDILDYYSETPSGDEFKDHNRAIELMVEDWDNIINSWSDAVREWFRKINEKYGTNFPA